MPLPALAIAGIAAAAGTVASTAGGLAGQGMNYRNSKRLAEYQNQLNIAQWERENAYNTPSAQMARLRAAGLNPHLFAPGGNLAASSPTLTTAQAPDYSFLGEIGTKGVQTFMQGLSISQMQANVEVTTQEARLKKLQADAYESGDYYGARSSAAWQGITESKARIDKISTDIAYRHEQARQIESQIFLYNKQAENYDSQIHLRSNQVVEILDRIDYRTVQEELIRSQMDVNSGRITLMDAQLQAIMKGMEHTDVQIRIGAEEWLQKHMGKGYSTGVLSPAVNFVYGIANAIRQTFFGNINPNNP